MAKPDTRRLDREIQQTVYKLEAVRKRELWPLNGRERREVLFAVTSGGYRVTRHRNHDRADRKVDTAWKSAETRLTSEITALQAVRQQTVEEAAKAKAAKKSLGWW